MSARRLVATTLFLLIASCDGPAPAERVGPKRQGPSLSVRTGVHQARWIMDPEEALAARIQLIRGARRSLRVRARAWSDDPAGVLLRDELSAAVARGVDLQVLSGPSGLVLADDRWAIVGPRELSARCLGSESRDRDRELLLGGPVLADLAADFAALAQSAGAKDLNAPPGQVAHPLRGSPGSPPTTWVPDPAPVSASATATALFQGLVNLPHALYLACGRDPDGAPGVADQARIAAALTALWAGARQEIMLQAPDLTLSAAARKALSADRSARAQLILSSDSLAASADPVAHAAYHAARGAYLGDLGAELFELRPGARLHGATFVVDATLAGVGGHDLDGGGGAARHGGGLGSVLVIWSDVLAQQLRQAITEDLAPDRSWVVAGPDDPSCYQLLPEKTAVSPDHPSFAEHYRKLGPVPLRAQRDPSEADPMDSMSLPEAPAGAPHSY